MQLKENSFPQKALIPHVEKNDLVELIAKRLNKKNTFGFRHVKCYRPTTKPEDKDYYTCYVSYEEKPWVAFCWANEFENIYICTPFWIELDEGASEKFFESGLYKEHCFCRHPRIPDQKIIPVFIEELENLENVAEKVLEIANATLKKPETIK